jgi:hypothetical protein
MVVVAAVGLEVVMVVVDSKFTRSPGLKLRPRYLSGQAPGRVEGEWIQSGCGRVFVAQLENSAAI